MSNNSNLKDIGIRLNQNSMFELINYKENDLHPILQAAITLIFFTNDDTYRGDYNGLYHLVGQANNNILNDLDLDLAHLSFSITEGLQQTYPEVLKTEFVTDIDRSTLSITLNVTTSDDIFTTNIYTINL